MEPGLASRRAGLFAFLGCSSFRLGMLPQFDYQGPTLTSHEQHYVDPDCDSLGSRGRSPGDYGGDSAFQPLPLRKTV